MFKEPFMSLIKTTHLNKNYRVREPKHKNFLGKRTLPKEDMPNVWKKKKDKHIENFVTYKGCLKRIHFLFR